jgi:hypothetical protein
VAGRKLSEAHAAKDAGRPQEAVKIAAEVQALAQRVIETVPESDAQIFDAAGKVEIQRASRDHWEAAKVGQRLYDGDFVKTGPNGTADIVSSDGTLFRVKPDSLFEVQKTRQIAGAAPGEASRQSEIRLTYGNIDTSTGEKSRTIVRTDSGTAEVQSRSRVGVDVNASRDTGASVYGGSATLQSAGGEKVKIGERERFVATRSGLGPKIDLPESPVPVRPENNVVFDFKKHEPITLRWSKVLAAARYRLQIAQSRLFIPDSMIVDLLDRQGVEAVVTVNEEGSYFWRVASIAKDKESTASEWSEVRRFKVLSEADQAGSERPAPSLQVDRPRVFSTVVIVSGKTDPGVAVSVDGEPADTDTSGSFKKTMTLNQEGFHTIVIKATNGAGKETVKKENVVIQF